MTPIQIGLETEEVNSVDLVQLLLISLDKIQCCVGAISSVDNPDVKLTFGVQYVECNGQWRHINCLTVVKDDNKYVFNIILPN